MTRFILTLLGGLALSAPALAEAIPLPVLSRYLTDLATVETTFTQVSDDGSLATGKLYIQRPGRMRFEYDPPNNALVIAGGGSLAIFDPVSDAGPEQYPLSKTPLNLILQRRVDLERSDAVLAYGSDGLTTSVVAQDPERPELGTIELVFSAQPVELRQWVITDEGGATTTVILGALEERDRLSAFLFDINNETQSRANR